MDTRERRDVQGSGLSLVRVSDKEVTTTDTLPVDCGQRCEAVLFHYINQTPSQYKRNVAVAPGAHAHARICTRSVAGKDLGRQLPGAMPVVPGLL